MKRFITENFSFTITVVKGGGCRNGHEEGDSYACEFGCPEPLGSEGGICPDALARISPLLTAVRCGGDLRTLGGTGRHSIEVGCDGGPIVFRIEGRDKAAIEPMGLGRLPECAEAVRGGFLTVAKDFGWTREGCPGHTAYISDEKLASDFGEGRHPFGLVVDGKVFGFASVVDAGGGAFELRHLSVMPFWRHFGYGGRLLDRCAMEAAAMGGTKLTLDLVDENAVLKDWYLSKGFRYTGSRTFPHLPFTVGYMEKAL
ncbi:MAG: TIGR04076 family protein [Oscillospiraceae bacterium]|nr:TIGR04076 family protein [Oscillospiraceae bacterium]